MSSILEQVGQINDQCRERGEGFVAMYFPQGVNGLHLIANVTDTQVAAGLYALCTELQLDIGNLIHALHAIHEMEVIHASHVPPASPDDWPQELEVTNG